MAESDARTEAYPGAEAEEFARLEAALDRISRRGAITIPPAPVATAAVATRLDALIAQLRGALEDTAGALEE